MARKSSKVQPIPRSGKVFMGWAVFNWGNSYDIVFRTRKEAQEYAWEGNIFIKDGVRQEATCWNDVKDHMSVVRVRCVVV